MFWNNLRHVTTVRSQPHSKRVEEFSETSPSPFGSEVYKKIRND